MSRAKKKTIDELLGRCEWHPPKLSYLHFHTDAEERDARGERQVQCEICKLWFWPDTIGSKP